ncbi:MAG: amidohydrolase family protein [Armatimonadetes bacterium]|nr:amidohydrolase family protein [Armatimonadota bacterium]
MRTDVHTHLTVTDAGSLLARLGREPFEADDLLRRMDAEGIDRSVVLPIDNPESDYVGIAHTIEVLRATRPHRDRLIPFCNVDPRAQHNSARGDLGVLLAAFQEAGARGVGEVTANIHLDDPRLENLFHHAGALGLPVLFHVAHQLGEVYGPADDLGLPRLERMLTACPETHFIGHAQTFWAEMSGDLRAEDRGIYPTGPVTPGRLHELLDRYPNLHADLSAGSGFNALNRDPEHGRQFLARFADKLLLGTDRFAPSHPLPPILGFLGEARLPAAKLAAIENDNLERLLGPLP